MPMDLIPGPNWIVPTPPIGDSSNRAASTEFVTNAVAASGTTIGNFITVNATTINATTIIATTGNFITVNATTVNATTVNATTIVLSGTINGVTLNNNAYSTYVPTISALSGTITSVSSSGRYKQIGKTVFTQIIVNITTNGSATGYIVATLPVTSFGNFFIPGREFVSIGKALQGFEVSTSQVGIVNYDNTYPGGDGFGLILNGTYESS